MTNEIEKLILDKSYINLKTETFNISNKPSINKDEHILDYLLRIDEKELHDKYLTKHIIHGILIDSLHFIKEALDASTKQRLTVAFSLLRKPFVYNLVVILRAFFTSDFLEDFNTVHKFDTAKMMDKEDLKRLIEISVKTLLTESITKDDIYNFVFNEDIPDSLINISNKALHPSTTRKTNLTGIQNINFIFSVSSDIDQQWTYFYYRLRVLIIYHVELCDFIVSHLLNLDEAFYRKRLTNRMKIYKNLC